jgi:hypothetical protein
MKSPFFFIFAWLLLSAPFTGAVSHAQSDSSEVEHLFVKGTWTTGLSGRISSFGVSNRLLAVGSGQRQVGFALDIQNGLFIRDLWALGLKVEIASDQVSGETFKVGTEGLYAGPWIERYFPFQDNLALVGGLSLGYLSVFNELSDLDAQPVEVEYIRSRGVGGQLSGAFQYLFVPNVAFDISVRLGAGWLSSQRETDTGTEKGNSGFYNELGVNFGFKIFLDEFFF